MIKIRSDRLQEGAVWPLQPAVYDIIRSNGLQATAYGYGIVSYVVQEGAVWRLQPVYDIIQSDRLQERAGHSICT
jgi:hypothetical protein